MTAAPGHTAGEPGAAASKRKAGWRVLPTWLAATVGTATVWLVVLRASFPILLAENTSPGSSYIGDATDCGTILSPRDPATGCGAAVSDRRILTIGLTALAVTSLGVAGRLLLRARKRTMAPSAWVVAICFTSVITAFTGLMAVWFHYRRFSYGDSAWTEALDYNRLHELAFIGGIVVVLVTLPIGFILGAARLSLTQTPR